MVGAGKSEKVKVTQDQLDINEWIKNHLSNILKKFIKTLPNENIIEVFNKKIYVVHYPLDNEMNFKRYIKIASLQENEEMFQDVNSDIYLYGHTHVAIYNKSTEKCYINPGALCCLGKADEAPYGILEIDKSKVMYRQLKVHYDVQKVIKDIKTLAFPGYKHVLKIFYISNKRR